MSTIKDCLGNEVRLEDTIYFSRGNAGAKAWEKAVVSKITAKTITFSGQTGSMYRSASEELRRGEGCFVIDMEKRK
jgi:hypothetical protein